MIETQSVKSKLDEENSNEHLNDGSLFDDSVRPTKLKFNEITVQQSSKTLLEMSAFRLPVLRPSITEISNGGRLVLSFNYDMRYPDNFANSDQLADYFKFQVFPGDRKQQI